MGSDRDGGARTQRHEGFLDRQMSRRTALRLFGISAAATFLAACGTGGTTSSAPTAAPTAQPSSGPATASPVPSGPVKGGEIRFAPNAEPDSLDPHTATNSAALIVLRNLFDTLLILNPVDLTFHPQLADSWTTSPDGMTYTFKLHPGVTFHDGTPFNAAAVKFNLDRVVNPETKSSFALTALGPYESTTVVDDLTAEIKLKSPYPPFLDGLSTEVLGMVSPAAVAKFGADTKINPVGTGFMKFVSYAPKQSIQLVRNDDYNWASPLWHHQGPAHVDKMTFIIAPTPAARLTALESGDANGIEDAPAQDVPRLKADPKYTYVEGRLPGMPRAWFMNTERAPLDNIDVRKALIHGINRAEFLQLAFFGLQPGSEGPQSPGTLYYSEKVEGLYPYDVAKAGQLLDGAGWKLGSDGIRAKDGQPLKLLAMGFAGYQSTYESTQSLLRKIGIDIEIQMLDSAAWVQAVHSGAHHLSVTAVQASDPSTIARYFHSRNYNGFAWTRLKDPAFDKMWDDAAVEIDEAKRAALYEQIQLFIMNNALIYPLNALVRLNFVSSKVKGVVPDARGVVPWLYDAYIES